MDKYRGNSRHSWTVSKFIENIRNDSDGLEEPMCQSRSSSRSTLESSDSMSNDFNTTTKNVQDFRILRKLGHGGFGRVFLAKYTGDDGQLVAMKVSSRMSRDILVSSLDDSYYLKKGCKKQNIF